MLHLIYSLFQVSEPKIEPPISEDRFYSALDILETATLESSEQLKNHIDKFNSTIDKLQELKLQGTTKLREKLNSKI